MVPGSIAVRFNSLGRFSSMLASWIMFEIYVSFTVWTVLVYPRASFLLTTVTVALRCPFVASAFLMACLIRSGYVYRVEKKNKEIRDSITKNLLVSPEENTKQINKQNRKNETAWTVGQRQDEHEKLKAQTTKAAKWKNMWKICALISSGNKEWIGNTRMEWKRTFHCHK